MEINIIKNAIYAGWLHICVTHNKGEHFKILPHIYIYIYIQLRPIKSAVFEIINFEITHTFLQNATNQGCLTSLVREIHPFRVFPLS